MVFVVINVMHVWNATSLPNLAALLAGLVVAFSYFISKYDGKFFRVRFISKTMNIGRMMFSELARIYPFYFFGSNVSMALGTQFPPSRYSNVGLGSYTNTTPPTRKVSPNSYSLSASFVSTITTTKFSVCALACKCLAAPFAFILNFFSKGFGFIGASLAAKSLLPIKGSESFIAVFTRFGTLCLTH